MHTNRHSLHEVFEEWEADFGRTYVLGNNPDKLRLKADFVDLEKKIGGFFEQLL